jgi:hypothetical protein
VLRVKCYIYTFLLYRVKAEYLQGAERSHRYFGLRMLDKSATPTFARSFIGNINQVSHSQSKTLHISPSSGE